MRTTRATLVIGLICLSCTQRDVVDDTTRASTGTNDTGEAVGTLPGGLVVLPTGAASYSIPIDVPPGRAGLQPALSFDYNSGRGNDWMGVGWTIGGASAIVPCARNHRIDGDIGAEGAFCLDGQRLHPVPASAATKPGGFPEYRTRPDQFARITQGGSGWSVETSDGLIHTYRTVLGAETFGAALAETVDRFGNRIEYSMWVGVDGRVRLEGATYNHGEFSPIAVVDLVYEDRPDTFLGFFDGRPAHMRQRLRRVDVKWDEQVVRSYRLVYEDDLAMFSSTGRSRLHRIQLCASATEPAECIPPTKFSYQDGGIGLDDDGVNVDLPRPAHDYEHTIVAADVTGDGSDDLAYVHHDGVNWQWVVARADRGAASGFAPAQVTGIDSGTVQFLHTLDLDNDRRDDLVYLTGPQHFRILTGDADAGLVDAQTYTTYAGYRIEFLTAADINGDGFRDVLTCERPTGERRRWVWWRADGSLDLRRTETEVECGSSGKLVFDHDHNGAPAIVEMGGSYRCEFQHHYREPLTEDFGVPPACPIWDDDQHRAALEAECAADAGCGDEPCRVGSSFEYSRELPDSCWKEEGPCEYVYHGCFLYVGVSTGNRVSTERLHGPLAFEWTSLFQGGGSAGGAHHVDHPLGTTDITGDGITDLLFIRDEWDGVPSGDPDDRTLLVHVGAGVTDEFLTVAPISILDDDVDQTMEHLRFIDWDAEGKSELLVPQDGSWRVVDYRLEDVVAYEGNDDDGDLSESVTDTGIPMTTALVVGDFDGDGLHDVITQANAGGISSWTLHRHRKATFNGHDAASLPDLLREVVNGYGEVQRVEYAPLTDVVTYADSCEFPQRCDADTAPVVVSLSVHDLPPATYAYHGPRVDAHERRHLGFERLTVTRARGPGYGPLITQYEFDNVTGDIDFQGEFLRAGIPTRTVTIASAGLHTPLPRVYETVVEPTVQSTAGGASYVVYPERTTWRIYEQAGTDEPYGTPLVERSLALTHDDYGNVRIALERLGDGTELLTDTTYTNDTDAWLLGLENRRTVRSTTPSEGFAVRTFDYHWTTTGALEELIRSPDDNAFRRRLRFEYDAFGNVEHTHDIDSLGRTHTTDTVWDDTAHVFPVEKTNPVGHTTHYEWNMGLGITTRVSDERLVGAKMTYDVFGRLIQSSVRDGADIPTGEHVYVAYERRDPGPDIEPSRLRVRKTTSAGQESWTNYDYYGRTERDAKYVSTEFSYADYRYDQVGRLAEITVPTWDGTLPSQSATYQYDNHDRLRFATSPDGNVVEHEYDGLTVTSTDGEGRTQLRELDAAGRLIRSVDAPSTDDAMRMCYAHGPFGQTVRYVRGCGEASASTTTYVTFDTYGRRTTLDDPATGARRYEYDGFDRLFEVRDGNGDRVRWNYDDIGRATSRVELDTGRVHTWRWDEEYTGKLDEMAVTGGAREEFDYDGFGRLRRAVATIEGETFAREFVYDAVGRVERIDYPAPESMPAFRVAYEYSSEGRLVAVRDADAGTLFWGLDDVDASGRIIGEVFGNGLETRRTYDSLGRPTSIHTAVTGNPDWLASGPSTRFWETYDWDLSGNLWRRTNELYDQRDTLEYDAVSRLRRVVSTDLTSNRSRDTWAAYDEFGNFTRRGAIDDYDVTPSGRVLAAGDRSYSHDGNGNVLGISSVGGGEMGDGDLPINITWTGFDKPDRIVTPIESIELTYNAAGGMIQRTAGGSTTIYVGGYERVTKPKGATEHRYRVRGPNGLVAQITRTPEIGGFTKEGGLGGGSGEYTEKILWVHSDHLRSPRAFTDAAGDTVQELGFDPWGAPRSPDNWYDGAALVNATSIDADFGGHRDGGPFVDMGGRHFDPYAATFLSPDSIVQAPSAAISFNRYAYTFQNPVSFTDPTGHAAQPAADTESGSNASSGVSLGFGIAVGLVWLGTEYGPDAANYLKRNRRKWQKAYDKWKRERGSKNEPRKSNSVAVTTELSAADTAKQEALHHARVMAEWRAAMNAYVQTRRAPDALDHAAAVASAVDDLATGIVYRNVVTHAIWHPYGWYNNGKDLWHLFEQGPAGLTPHLMEASGATSAVQLLEALKYCEDTECTYIMTTAAGSLVGRGKRFRRPKWRTGTRDAVWKQARMGNKVVRDPNTNEVIKKSSDWQIGHKPGYEFRKLQELVDEGLITEKQARDAYHDLSVLQPEARKPNASGRHEGHHHVNHWLDYFGFGTNSF